MLQRHLKHQDTICQNIDTIAGKSSLHKLKLACVYVSVWYIIWWTNGVIGRGNSQIC